MTYQEIGFRGIYKKFCIVPMNDNLKNLLQELQVADIADYALGYGYIDHEAGMTLDVLATAVKNEQGFQFIDIQEKTRALARIGAVADEEILVLSGEEEKGFYEKYARRVEELKNYDVSEDIEKTRGMQFFDGVRHPEFPDDIQVHMVKKGLGTEVCWIRIEGLGDGCIIGELLNEPNQDFGCHMHDTIEFHVTETEDKSIICYADMGVSEESPAKLTEEQENELKQIMDDIEAGLIDDPMEDYKYLQEQAELYREHALIDEIRQRIGKIMFEDIPAAVRKGLKDDFSGDCESFDRMIEEAEAYIGKRFWGAAINILDNLIGDGVDIQDSEETEFRTMWSEIQYLLYLKFFKSEKKMLKAPVNFGRLYGLYGCALVEYEQIDGARKFLGHSLHYNPLDFGIFFEFAETYKIKKELEEYEKMNREYLRYAYRAIDIGRLYRNLGFAYIEKEDYETAIMLYNFSLAYDPDNETAKHELEYIAERTGTKPHEPTQEEATAVLEKENIQIGAAKEVLELIFKNAYYESNFNHDVEKTDYFCKLYYDLTRNEESVRELMDAARASKDVPVQTGIFAEKEETRSPYDIYKEASLKEVFPSFPEITECRLRMEFTIKSAKYAPVIEQILSHIDDLSKAVEDNEVSVLFTDIKTIADNMVTINDLYYVASTSKSFQMTINDVPRDREGFRYFVDYIEETFKLGRTGTWSVQEICKKYKRAAAPKRAKKVGVEDSFKVDLTGCTPQEVVSGLAQTYASVYLADCDVNTYNVSEDEIVLCANDDFVVDIWVSPYGYGETMTGETEGKEPYRTCTYLIQELTKNNLFKYNHAGFKRIFVGEWLTLEVLKFAGPDYYRPEINHFYKINELYPELRLQEKYEEMSGTVYSFVVFEMENADGTIGTGIGYTDKPARTLLMKVCKELETRTPHDLEGNGANGMEYALSKSFIAAYLSWKGEKKTARLENHLKYYVFEETYKDKGTPAGRVYELAEEAQSGKFGDVERKTYADIGRRKKK